MKLPTYFISHGGGPWPWMADMRASMRVLEAALQDMPRQIGVTPKAILVISGHWEDATFAVMSNPRPGMLYDYYGFPPHTYNVVYAAPGAPEVALRVQSLIAAAGLPTRLDPDRGFDHGTFSPLEVMYPDAQVPVLQLSLQQGLDPAQHIALGRALAPLRDEGVLIVGSGLSYHNLRLFGPAGKAPSQAFDQWLQATLGSVSAQRETQLLQWESAPAARVAHPREEHLIPLMVVAGAAGSDPGVVTWSGDFLGSRQTGFHFG